MRSAGRFEVGPAIPVGGDRPVVVAVEGGKIAAVVESSASVDARRRVAPGLIDIQVNGFGGVHFGTSELTVADVRKATDLLAAEGVTRFVPTIVTGSHAMYLDALGVLASACEQDDRVHDAVLCFHMEGPWISPDDGPRGAHPPRHVRPPSWSEFEAWQAAAGGRIGYVSIAPEVDGAVEMIARLSSAGIVVAIAHTGATGEQIRAAVDAGARLSTHLGNGAHATVPRHDNVIWHQLGEDRLTASFIADGHHLPGPILKSMIRAKTPARSVLTSDATSLAGMPPGQYTEFGMGVELRPDGRLCLAGTPYLAGSAQSLLHAVETATRIGGVTLDQAIEMASTNPARLFGVDHECGRIAVGMRADLIEFDWDTSAESQLMLRRTVCAGAMTYQQD